MKNLLLVLIMVSISAFGYLVVTRLDRFFEENQRLIAREKRKGQSRVRIAAENPALLNGVAPALQSCSDADPHIAFFLSSGKAGRILEKLQAEQIDIVLLEEGYSGEIDEKWEMLMVTGEKAEMAASCFGLPIEDIDPAAKIRVVWKKERKSKDRDRVIFAMENDHCRSKCGYADYL